MRRPPLFVGAVLVLSSVVHAATFDCGVAGKAKIFDRLDSVGTAKINYRSASLPCIQKGPAGSTAQVSGTFDILYVDQPGSAQGAFVMPAPWFLNKDTHAKFLNTSAPSGPSQARKVGVKAEKLARFGSRGLGDTSAIDITNPPGPGGVLAVLTVHNAVDGNTYRTCTKWATGSGSNIRHEVIDGGAGRKLFLDHGVVASCTFVPPTTSTSTSVTTTTSTSVTSTTSTSGTSTTSTSSSTTTTLVLSFVTGPAGGTCGRVKSGGAAGATRKSLTCGGLNIGGGQSTVAEGPTPAGAETQMNLSTGGPILTISARTSVQTGSINNCSATGCRFGPWLPIKSAGTSTCVKNSFLAPGATGTVNTATGVLSGSFPLNSDVYLTGNGTSPCPKCILSGTFKCDPGWTAGTGVYSDSGKACVAVNAAGDTYDCAPPTATFLGPITVNLNPITTGTASFSNAGGLFCPSQANTGAFGCAGDGSAANAICPGGNAPPLIDYIEEIGTPAGPLSSTPAPGTLASVFCIPTVGGALGFLVNSAGNLPGPGATSLPGTLELLP